MRPTVATDPNVIEEEEEDQRLHSELAASSKCPVLGLGGTVKFSSVKWN